jgi:hypothetical protein
MNERNAAEDYGTALALMRNEAWASEEESRMEPRTANPCAIAEL